MYNSSYVLSEEAEVTTCLVVPKTSWVTPNSDQMLKLCGESNLAAIKNGQRNSFTVPVSEIATLSKLEAERDDGNGLSFTVKDAILAYFEDIDSWPSYMQAGFVTSKIHIAVVKLCPGESLYIDLSDSLETIISVEIHSLQSDDRDKTDFVNPSVLLADYRQEFGVGIQASVASSIENPFLNHEYSHLFGLIIFGRVKNENLPIWKQFLNRAII